MRTADRRLRYPNLLPKSSKSRETYRQPQSILDESRAKVPDLLCFGTHICSKFVLYFCHSALPYLTRRTACRELPLHLLSKTSTPEAAFPINLFIIPPFFV